MSEGKKDFFTSLIETGQVAVDKNGRITLFGEFTLFFPPKVLFRLIEYLERKIGIGETDKLLLGLAESQIEDAYKRYIEKLKMQKVEKKEIINISLKIVNSLGWGSVEIRKMSFVDKTFETVSRNTLSLKYKEIYKKRATRSIDIYLLGLIKKIFESVFETELEVKETTCIARDDKYCTFVGKPKS